MIQKLKRKGRGVIMDSTYMSDIMAQIGRYEQGINMVGIQSNNTVVKL